jgi:FkbH-like protein
MIKCVIWDIDNTLLDGVFLEPAPAGPAGRPPANRAMTAVLADLAGRGILHALASRNPPEAAEYVEQATGHRFAAAECGWDRKSDAIARISSGLGLAADAIAFVDDDALERAEVSFALPGILVLAPEEMPGAAGWPQFSPAVLTDEGRRRGESYLARQRRQAEAQAFGGSRDDFLRYCQTLAVIGTASTADLPRLRELSVRTSQFNSMREAVSEETFSGLLTCSRHRVFTVRLRDRYGDDGLVGACAVAIGVAGDVAASGAAVWDVPLLMMSCRAIGRGVIDMLLAWLCRTAGLAGASQITIPCVIDPRNVPLRIALTGAGFRAEQPGPARTADAALTADASRTALYHRRLDGPLPGLPDWARDQTGGARS